MKFIYRISVLMITVISAFAVPPNWGFGTTIVTYVGRNEITIGADSKMFTLASAHDNAVKIVVRENVAFANAGLRVDPDYNVDISQIALESLIGVDDLSVKFAKFENSVSNALVRVFGSRLGQQQNVAIFRKEFEGKPIVQTIFASFREGQPRTHLRFFVPNLGEEGVKIAVHRSACLTNCEGLHVCLGHFDVIDQFLAKNPDFWSKTKISDSIRSLIEMEIKANPAKVGPPIRILRLTPTGSSWLNE